MFEISVSGDIIPLADDYLVFLQAFLQNILKDFESENRICSVLICDNPFIQQLNKQYRLKDYPTDVLSFTMDEDEEFILPHSSLGDIVISSEMAFSQAQEFQVSYEEEFARLTIHGLLHLLGYDHELGEEEHKEMFSIQDTYMIQFMASYNNTDSALI